MWSMWMQFVARLRNEDDGQGLVEYALIIALVAIVLVAGLTALGTGINTTVNNITSSL